MSRTTRSKYKWHPPVSDGYWKRIKERTRRLAQKLIRQRPDADTAECRALHRKARGIREWEY